MLEGESSGRARDSGGFSEYGILSTDGKKNSNFTKGKKNLNYQVNDN